MTETSKTQKIQVVEMSNNLLIDLYSWCIEGVGSTLTPYQKKALEYEVLTNNKKIEVPVSIIEGIVGLGYTYDGCSIASRELLCDLIETAHDASDEFVELDIDGNPVDTDIQVVEDSEETGDDLDEFDALRTVMEILAGSDIPEDTEDEEQEEDPTETDADPETISVDLTKEEIATIVALSSIGFEVGKKQEGFEILQACTDFQFKEDYVELDVGCFYKFNGLLESFNDKAEEKEVLEDSVVDEDDGQEEPFTQDSEIKLCMTVNQLNTLYASIRADEKTIKHEKRGLLSVYPDMEFYSDTELMTSLAKVVKDTQARL